MADKVDKGVKRKRHEHPSSKPSKKVAIEGDRNIKISFQGAEEWAPIIGTDPSNIGIELRRLFE
jgi:DNA-directed RNA polymerase I subunit RPA49